MKRLCLLALVSSLVAAGSCTRSSTPTSPSVTTGGELAAKPPATCTAPPTISGVSPAEIQAPPPGGTTSGTLRISGSGFQQIIGITGSGALSFTGAPKPNGPGTRVQQDYEFACCPAAGTELTIVVETACGSASASVIVAAPKGKPADILLDQSFRPEGSSRRFFNQVGDRGDKAQTFTVGIAGTLVRVDVFLNRHGGATHDILADVRATTGGVPGESNDDVLGSVVVPGSQVTVDGAVVPESFGRVSIPFNVAVAVGDVLAIVLRSSQPEPGRYAWQEFNIGSPSYPGGDMFARGGIVDESGEDGTWHLNPSDFAFETYVRP
jgi:hypothetical protein